MNDVSKINYDRESYIMVVDDDQTLLKFFKIHLNKFFSKVVVVKNANEASEVLKNKKIDLVLSDIRMPRTDGLQLLKRIRNFDASIPVFLISGEFVDEEMQEKVDSLADGFLRKPFTIEEIQNFINLGLKKRKLLLELSGLVGDNKVLLDLLRGKASTARLKESDLISKADDLLSDLKKVS